LDEDGKYLWDDERAYFLPPFFFEPPFFLPPFFFAAMMFRHPLS
jgi:hypothetical protein